MFEYLRFCLIKDKTFVAFKKVQEKYKETGKSKVTFVTSDGKETLC